MKRRLAAYCSLVVVLGCDGASRDDDAGADASGGPVCSAEAPEGSCPDGELCRAGACLDEGLFCSDARPSGLCAREDDRCFEGGCVPADTLCSDANPTGLCTGALVCMDGVCATTSPCAPDEPLGFCPAGEACVDGACVARTMLCSDASPMGLCPEGEACLDGVCVDEETVCSPARPAGACPDGRTCIDGACVEPSDVCSPSSPTGTCPVGEVCDEGTCVADPSACSTSNPTGTCPAGRTCAGGTCVVPDAMCSASSPTGTCPSGRVCASGACVTSGAPPSCANGVEDGLETDVDCGGPRCEACGTSAGCVESTDCRSLDCTGNVCGPAVPSYAADEDFETGDLSRYPYVHAAMNPWGIEDEASECHAGSFCMRTNVFHAGGETARVSLALSVREDTEVVFWARTNTEPSEHFFRFSIDGVTAVEVSGATAWTEYRVPIEATGAGGADRVLTWEYERSSFVHPDHAPHNEVWVDDIDLPAWNTPPSVPELLWPGNGARLTDATPQFRWRSVDPDFDTIIYELQLDRDPTFALPTTTGETMERTFSPSAPLTEGVTYYWRVRSKDDSDYRWSAWSPVSSVRVDAGSPYPALFRHDLGSELALGTVGPGAEIAGDVVRGAGSSFTVSQTVTTGMYQVASTVSFRDLPAARVGTSAMLRVQSRFYGDCSSAHRINVSAESRSLGNVQESFGCVCLSSDRAISITDIAGLAADGAIDMLFDPERSGTYRAFFCSQPLTATLTYEAVSSGVYLSPPIYLSDLDAPNWEHVRMNATAGTTLTILDGAGAPIPDAQIPGNTSGLAPGTHVLWNLDPAAYPVIRLRASFARNAELDGWEVTANDGYAFHFTRDGDAEGWTAADDGASATLTASGGLIRLAGVATGTNPRIELRLPAEVDAARFTELVVRLRTSNNHADDTVTLFWENNFGFFDAVRSIAVTDFLFAFQDVAFDLTVVPAAPAQRWQGRLEALRIDPVLRFEDASGAPAAGWAEIESIWVH
jgi:hypothetical protein